MACNIALVLTSPSLKGETKLLADKSLQQYKVWGWGGV
jgi:hypothetical protein